jgi:iron complex outermembrane receptor protein
VKSVLTALFVLLLPVLASAQFSISGKITDRQSGQPLPGATISIQSLNLNTVTDTAGKYSIARLKAGSYSLSVSYVGYQTAEKNIALHGSVVNDFTLAVNTVLTDEVTVSGTRAADNSPTTHTNLNRQDIQKNNLGQDLPFLLDQTPSLVVQSDAGAGVGYTYIHIRGSDATRINVTINGIPYNDSEEQAVYFVDLPDFASSVDNIQIQRGVGTSTNGAGAFGASINIQTTTRRDTSYVELNNSAGSYGTVKNTINLGTGLIDSTFSFDGRLSRIRSNGYIDRASSNLQSYFLTGAYYGKNTLIRFNTFGGTEHTYQAWDGDPEDSVKAGNRTYNSLGSENLNGTAPFYSNQTDNYTQDHYQLLIDQKISDKISFSGALHYTHGFGYYEEYVPGDSVKNYGLKPAIVGGDTIRTTALTRRLWLNNQFYGATYNFNYVPEKNLHITIGGAYNQYRNDHYDDIEWTQQTTNITPNYQYANNNAFKTDFNIYGKADYRIGDVTLWADMQYRHIYYNYFLINNYDQVESPQQQVILNFFNPKAGVTYQMDAKDNLYASFAVGNHEPDRDDYTEATLGNPPRPENLKDFELGYRTQQGVFTGGINAYYMLYYNQLVLTGTLNDVGDQIRTNVKNSFREGIEFDGRLQVTSNLTWSATAAVSANKIKDFNEALYDYDNNTTVNYQFKETDIAFSPGFVGSSEISYRPLKNSEIAFISKYVGRQYLDNSSNMNPPGYAPSDPTSKRYLNGYFVNGVRFAYNFSVKHVKNIGVSLLINNIFSEQYESNGATYPDIESSKVVNYNYFFPQAPINFLVGLNLKF